MKKFWVCCLTALCVVLAGCAGDPEENRETEPPPQIDARQEAPLSEALPPEAPPSEGGAFSDQFTGSWLAGDMPQYSINISSKDGADYAIEILRSDSPADRTIWQLTGTYDEIWEGIAYVGSKYEEVPIGDGTDGRTPVPDREEITGLLYIEDNGTLYWLDDFDHEGDSLYFVKE